MKKVIILAVVGLLVGIGGGTGIAVVLRPGAVADSTAADSSSAHNDTTAVIGAAPAGEHAPAAQPTDSIHADSTVAVKDTAHAESKDAHVAPVVDTASHKPATGPILAEKTGSDSLHRAQVRRIGRIFAAMSPREAAKVLQQLEDSDVTTIVASLTEKQAAAILQAFPPERAAAISRGSLRAAQQGQRP